MSTLAVFVIVAQGLAITLPLTVIVASAAIANEVLQHKIANITFFTPRHLYFIIDSLYLYWYSSVKVALALIFPAKTGISDAINRL